MSNPNLTRLEVGQVIPAFTLPGADGMPHSPWDYKQREHLLLLFTRSSTTSETHGLLRAFAQRHASFREEECSILAISPDTVVANLGTQEQFHLPFALLADPKHQVRLRYLGQTIDASEANTNFPSSLNCTTPTDTKLSQASFPVSFVLADRYSALYQMWIAENEADLPPIEELLESLYYLNKLCTP